MSRKRQYGRQTDSLEPISLDVIEDQIADICHFEIDVGRDPVRLIETLETVICEIERERIETDGGTSWTYGRLAARRAADDEEVDGQ